ncbi:uncharacterized protein B0I36DRAFT_348260 [Microdochium trichocladiopsis]|uniref:Uncharacterized protein n=1 Tax=Microdochium trichocladiopsis TaxID=1682393 RepID=A0A9P9BRX0_9PEZI|nr:uncharacterized protein B0I36DRAFT_348260 [Microdochium trichocladiopsis]KAH7033163.1 hypothetical protein B0I36DRAFT_348260 [Microdochium trichocladiopsis]
MEALRKQLGEAEGHLQDRDKKYRELNANFKASTREWADRVTELEAAVKELQGKNQELKSRNIQLERRDQEYEARLRQARQQQPLETQNGKQPPEQQTPPPGGLIITPENKRYMEEKYQKVKDRLAEAEKKAERLERQLYFYRQKKKPAQDALGKSQQQGDAETVVNEKGTTPENEGDLAPVSDADMVAQNALIVTKEDVRHYYDLVRECIGNLTREYFNEPLDSKALDSGSAVPAQHAAILQKLTPSWKSFLTDQGYTSYIFRALIWRYLDEFMFKKPESVWGADIPQALALLTSKMALSARPGTNRDEFKRWRAQTVDLLRGNRSMCKFDDAVMSHLTQTIMGSIEWYLTNKPRNHSRVTTQVSEIVALGAELSALVARSHFAVMMSPRPGSDLIHGFQPSYETMELRHHQLRGAGPGEGGVVDLMVTPCLISTDGEDYIVLEKAEVMM